MILLVYPKIAYITVLDAKIPLYGRENGGGDEYNVWHYLRPQTQDEDYRGKNGPEREKKENRGTCVIIVFI